jgi:hypothetical protein
MCMLNHNTLFHIICRNDQVYIKGINLKLLVKFNNLGLNCPSYLNSFS